jgi:glycerate dehydrogenase
MIDDTRNSLKPAVRIVFLDRATIAPQIRLRRPTFAHEFVEFQRTTGDEVVARLADADVAIVNKVPLRATALARVPRLKLIAVAATGSDCIDKDWCAAHGVAVSNIRGYAVNTVPEHTFALMLALRRNVVAYRQDVISGRWQASGQFCFFDHPIHDLAFGMVPVFAAHKGVSGLGPLYTPWQEVLETSDIITLHAPLTERTRHMIGRAEFRAMKRRPLLLNTARGGLVDESALVEALDEGLIAGAGFDVVEGEPPPPDSPLLRVADRPNVIITPHIAWAADEAQQALADQLMDNIEAFVAGTPRNLVHGAY